MKNEASIIIALVFMSVTGSIATIGSDPENS